MSPSSAKDTEEGSSGSLKADRSSATRRIPFKADFVGRAEELACLEQMLNAAGSGLGGAALLVGEAGIGKTRTAEEFAEKARGSGARVAWGRCWEGEECPAFGPWSEALRGLVTENDDAHLRKALGKVAEDIAIILPEIGPRVGALSAPLRLATRDGAQRLFASLTQFLRSAGRRKPLVIVLDNVHLADDSSLRFLRHLGPELAGSRLFILGTFRAVGEPFREALGLAVEELAKARSFRRLDLGGLGREEVRQLVARGLGPSSETGDRIHERTEGNPLFVVELVRQMLTDARLDSAKVLPEGIGQIVRRRLERLSPACRDMLATAAVLGRSFDVDTLGRTHDRAGSPRAVNLVAEAEASAILQAAGPAPGRFQFSHELVREALLAGVPAAEQSRLHERAALVLEQIEASDGQHRSVEILHHLVESGTLVQPERLVARAIRAADEAKERYAPDQALRIVDETLRAWERLGRALDARVAPLMHRQGRFLTDLLRPVEARESLVRAFDLYEQAGDRRAAVDVALTPAAEKHAEATWWTTEGVPARGVQELRERALALVSADSRDHALLILQRGSRADLRDALEFARNAGDAHLEALALTHLAGHELAAWEVDACGAWLAKAEALATAEDDYDLLLTCAYTRYCHGLITGSSSSASAAVEAIFNLARRSRSLAARTLGLMCAASLAQKHGDWERARREARECIALLAASGPVYTLFTAQDVLIKTELQTGHLKAFRAAMEAAIAAGNGWGPVDQRVLVVGARLARDGSLMPPAPEPSEIRIPNTDGPLSLLVAGGLLWAAFLAEIHQDRRLASFCLERLRPWKGTFWDFPLDSSLGLLCSVLDRLDEAVTHFEEAIVFCRRAGYLPELAWAVSNLAETLARRDSPGDRQRAEALFDEGLTVCQNLGMTPLGKRILAARSELSGSEGKRRAQPDGLTHREIEVLRLVSRGLTNAEIAERLYVSPLTVARHVHNLLDKTGMANRAEVTAWAGKRGFLEDGP